MSFAGGYFTDVEVACYNIEEKHEDTEVSMNLLRHLLSLDLFADFATKPEDMAQSYLERSRNCMEDFLSNCNKP